MKKVVVITISGPHGSGKSTYAQAIAKALNLKYVSSGQTFRELAKEHGCNLEDFSKKCENDKTIDKEIDQRTINEAKKGNVILEGQLAAWMASDKVDIKIYLTASNNIRFKRIAKREKLLYQEAEQETRDREESERRRFQEIYDINMMDLSIYDLVIDTSLLPLDDTITMLKNIISNYIQKKNRRKK